MAGMIILEIVMIQIMIMIMLMLMKMIMIMMTTTDNKSHSKNKTGSGDNHVCVAQVSFLQIGCLNIQHVLDKTLCRNRI